MVYPHKKNKKKKIRDYINSSRKIKIVWDFCFIFILYIYKSNIY